MARAEQHLVRRVVPRELPGTERVADRALPGGLPGDVAARLGPVADETRRVGEEEARPADHRPAGDRHSMQLREPKP